MKFMEKTKITCSWCGRELDHIFEGDEVQINGEYHFMGYKCLKIYDKLLWRAKRLRPAIEHLRSIKEKQDKKVKIKKD